MTKNYPLLPFLVFATFVAGTATLGLPVFASVGWFGSRKNWPIHHVIPYWAHRDDMICNICLEQRVWEMHLITWTFKKDLIVNL